VAVFVGGSNKLNHCPGIVERHPLARADYSPARSAGNSEATPILRRLHRDIKSVNNVLCLADDYAVLGASKKQPYELSIFVHGRA
jgi:hypothetical protein